jgi:hypothetical protein
MVNLGLDAQNANFNLNSMMQFMKEMESKKLRNIPTKTTGVIGKKEFLSAQNVKINSKYYKKEEKLWLL